MNFDKVKCTPRPNDRKTKKRAETFVSYFISMQFTEKSKQVLKILELGDDPFYYFAILQKFNLIFL